MGPTKYIVDCIEEKKDKLNKLYDFSRQEMLQVWQKTSNSRYLEGYINPIIFINWNICINGKSIFD